MNGAMVNNNATELGRLFIGIMEDDTRWIIAAGSLGSVVKGVAIREKWEFIPRTNRALICSS